MMCRTLLEAKAMETQAPEIRRDADTKDQIQTISFSHLDSAFNADDEGNAPVRTTYGFPAAQEEGLYETGFLLRTFLKC